MFNESELFAVLDDIKNILMSLINLKLITTVIIIVISSSVGLYVVWHFLRVTVNVLKNAFVNGRLSLSGAIESKKARSWYKKEGYKYYDSYDEYVEEYNSNIGDSGGSFIH